MSDNTYQPKIYTAQGAVELVVASGGLISMQSGSELSFESGSEISGAMALSSTLQLTGDSLITAQSGSELAFEAGSLISGTLALSGTLQLTGDGTVFDDLQSQLIGQRLESAASHVTTNNAESSVTYDNSTTAADYVTMNIQMSHKWKIGSVIFPHLHWWQPNANMPNWMIQYRWQVNNGAKTTAWTSLIRGSNAFTYVIGVLNQITLFGAAGITPPVGASLSDVVQFRIIRDKTNSSGLFGGADTTGASVDAVSFDIHFEMDQLGSNSEYTK